MEDGNTAAELREDERNIAWGRAADLHAGYRREYVKHELNCATWRAVSAWCELDEDVSIASHKLAAAVLCDDDAAEQSARAKLEEAIRAYLRRDFDETHPVEDFM